MRATIPFLRRRTLAPRMRDAFAAFESAARRRPLSDQRLDAYRNVLEDFAAWAGPSRRLSDVAPEEADAYATRIPHYLSAATFADKLSALRTVWATLLPGGANPWVGIRRRPPDARPREPLTRAELDATVAAARSNNRTGGELALLVQVGAWTGLRLGDAVRLRWDAVVGDEISVRTRKTGAIVRVPLLAPLRSELDAWRAAHGSGALVFPRLAAAVDRNHGRTTNVAQQVVAAMRRAGLETTYRHEHTARRRPLRGFHSLRHTFVTMLAESGLPSDIVAAIVGHASVAMTAHYTHARTEFVRAALERAGLVGVEGVRK